jgi:hypothetical protein
MEMESLVSIITVDNWMEYGRESMGRLEYIYKYGVLRTAGSTDGSTGTEYGVPELSITSQEPAAFECSRPCRYTP